MIEKYKENDDEKIFIQKIYKIPEIYYNIILNNLDFEIEKRLGYNLKDDFSQNEIFKKMIFTKQNKR